jgi:hypothetical protein
MDWRTVSVDDGVMQAALREHPALRWKSLNVKQHRGQPSDAGAD